MGAAMAMRTAGSGEIVDGGSAGGIGEGVFEGIEAVEFVRGREGERSETVYAVTERECDSTC